jgi:2-C-methyl-D-erythritol 4-phosphate cytidylyltransferase
MGERVTVVQGDPRNLKITLPSDLSLARAILGVRGPESRPVHKRF